MENKVILIRFVCGLILVLTFCLPHGLQTAPGGGLRVSPIFSEVSAFTQIRETPFGFFLHLLSLVCLQLKIILMPKWHLLWWHIWNPPTVLNVIYKDVTSLKQWQPTCDHAVIKVYLESSIGLNAWIFKKIKKKKHRCDSFWAPKSLVQSVKLCACDLTREQLQNNLRYDSVPANALCRQPSSLYCCKLLPASASCSSS